MVVEILSTRMLSNNACVAAVEVMVSYLDTDTLVDSKLLPVEHCVNGHHEAKGL